MNNIPSFDRLDEVEAALTQAIAKRTINKRKWAVEFYFPVVAQSCAQVLFRSESMPRKEAEEVMDELISRKGVMECWLQDMGAMTTQ